MSIDRRELQDSARKAFGSNGPAPDAQKSWDLISEMGWLMMAVPEAMGGLGLGREAEGVIHTEIGHALVPGPAMAQMLAISALAAADALPQRDDLLARAMGGEVMTASLDMSPALCAVPDADIASHVLVLGDGHITLQPLNAPGVSVVPHPTWDTSRRLFDIDCNGSQGALIIATGAEAAALAGRLKAQLLFALAGDSLGGADAILDLTVDYLKTRRQFDRPLAMFQALKHRVADLKTLLATSEALFWSRANGDGTLVEMGALKAHATTAYRTIAEEAVQLHGGIGLTSEYHCHLFLKRAMLNCALGGDSDYWEEQAGKQALASNKA